MAFYTSRVDDDGNEIERRLSSRSTTPSLANSETSSQNDLSSRSYDTRSNSVRMSTRRYLNTAVYVESANEGQDMQSICDEANKCYSKLETQSDIVPPLDLQSEENYPTTRDYTYSYRKHCEAAKLEVKPDLAYETWLSAKRKVLSDEAERRRKIEEAKKKELEDRKRLAQEQYEKWLENKSRMQKQNSTQSVRQNTPPNQISIQQLTRSNLSEDEVKQRLDEWELTKRRQLERRRRKKREEEQRIRDLEESRRQAAADAWANWSAGAAKKPNPVPLNRGIFTLRGTISDIFVNPNEWQPILPSADGDGDN